MVGTLKVRVGTEWKPAGNATELLSDAVINANATTINANVAALQALSNTPVIDMRRSPYNMVASSTIDQTVAAQAAITDAITAGGTVVMPERFRITAPLDISAAAGSNKGLGLVGAGSGNVFGDPNSRLLGGTRILSDHTGPAIIGHGLESTNDPISNLRLQNFSIQAIQVMTGQYLIDLDYATTHLLIEDVHVNGGNLVGNGGGINWKNMAYGQSEWNRVTAVNFYQGTGFRVAVETTAYAAAPNSGNSVFSACGVIDALTGWDFIGTGNLLNSMTLISCKVVNDADYAGSVGFRLRAGTELFTLISPHAERASTGFYLEGHGHTLLSPLVSYPSGGIPDANSAGVRITGNNNSVERARLSQTHTGVLLAGSAKDNYASAYPVTGAPLITEMFYDGSSSGANTLINLTKTGGRFIQTASGLHKWSDGVNPPDTNLYRNGSGQLKTDQIMLASGGLGAPTTVATTQGTIVARMAMYNQSGVFIGYVHLRDS